MKQVLIVLSLGIAGILMWTYRYHPQEWQSWSLQMEREIASLTDRNQAEAEERWFLFQRDSLLDEYAGAEQEYEDSKRFLEGEFDLVKDRLETEDVEEIVFETEVTRFREEIERKKVLFEERKAEIERQIEEARRQYEETRATLIELNDSIGKVREGVVESVDAIEDLRDSVSDSIPGS